MTQTYLGTQRPRRSIHIVRDRHERHYLARDYGSQRIYRIMDTQSHALQTRSSAFGCRHIPILRCGLGSSLKEVMDSGASKLLSLAIRYHRHWKAILQHLPRTQLPAQCCEILISSLGLRHQIQTRRIEINKQPGYYRLACTLLVVLSFTPYMEGLDG